jgi:hypothetical protein
MNAFTRYFIRRNFFKTFAFILLVLTELVVVIFLLTRIFHRPETIQISPIPQKYILKPTSSLNYYYEFLPGNIIYDKQDWLSYSPTYSINSDGLNEKQDYQHIKGEKITRIITLGDSHTFGYLVSTPNNYPEQLEQLLNNNCAVGMKFEVINLGVPGFDLQYSVERYRRKGMQYNPDIVLWFIKKDDFTELKELTAPKIGYYRNHYDVEEKRNFTQKGYHYYEVYKANKDIQDEVGFQKISMLQSGYLDLMATYYSKKLVLFSYDDSELKDYRQVIEDYINQRPETFFYSKIPPLYKYEGLHLEDGHPSQEGYKIIASDLLSFLESNKIIDCNRN